jgi:hypothetical protein
VRELRHAHSCRLEVLRCLRTGRRLGAGLGSGGSRWNLAQPVGDVNALAEPPPDSVCPRCGTPFVFGQEYCLECGLRLGVGGGLIGTLSNAWRERFGWYPGDWIWAVLLALVIATLGGVAAVILADSGRSSNNPLVATHAGQPREPVTPPETATVALPTVPRGEPTTRTPTTASPPPTTPRRAGGLTEWPARRNGFTVVLESIPGRAGRSFAVARARAAARAGLPQVGVLDSSLYSSLHPGYWVVFSGIYASQGQADAATQAAAGKGFGAAYSRQITR